MIGYGFPNDKVIEWLWYVAAATRELTERTVEHEMALLEADLFVAEMQGLEFVLLARRRWPEKHFHDWEHDE